MGVKCCRVTMGSEAGRAAELGVRLSPFVRLSEALMRDVVLCDCTGVEGAGMVLIESSGEVGGVVT